MRDSSQTIEVNGCFSLKQVTKEQFVATWVDQVKELNRLDYNLEWREEVTTMIDIVTAKATQEFDRLLKVQANDAK